MSRRGDPRPEDATDAVADDRAIPTVPLEEPEDVAALRAAITLRAGTPGAGVPNDEYLKRLGDRLLGATNTSTPPRTLVTRRAAIIGTVAASSVAAAAALVTTASRQPDRQATPDLVPTNGEWVPVATATQLHPGVVQSFSSRGVLGFVSTHGNQIIAVSGVCTHLGCLLTPNGATARLDCPCHRTSFNVDGTLATHQLATPPAPLPRLTVRRRNDTIEVLLPPTTP